MEEKKTQITEKLNITRLIIIFSIFYSYAFSQKEANIWYFGDRAGLDFNGGAPAPLLNSQMHLEARIGGGLQGSASIADENGNLLFYTDGDTVWDKSHLFMPNGVGLLGDKSSCQSALIAPVLGNKNQYYIFTVDGTTARFYPIHPSLWRGIGLHYSVVDITLRGNGTLANPLGDVVASQKNINLTDSTTEKLTAAIHANGTDYWIITSKHNKREIHAFLVTCAGVSTTPVISYIPPLYQLDNSFVTGYLTSSADGKTIVESGGASLATPILMHDFDNANGEVKSSIIIANQGAYGVAFSSNDSLIYAGSLGIRQYQRFAPNVSATEKILDNNWAWAGMQLGPDGKIYIASNTSPFITRINNPNSITTPNIAANSVSLGGRKSASGLPNIFMSYFNKPKTKFSFPTPACLGDSIKFSISNILGIDSVKWNFDDFSSGISDSSKLLNPLHFYSSSGNYNVRLITYKPCFVDTFFQTVTVNSLPLIEDWGDTTLCAGESINLSVNDADFYLWSTGQTTNSIEILGAGQYWVTLTDISGCFNSDTLILKEEDCSIFIPNAFTPNNDGVNDVFIPLTPGVPRLKMYVYNRWGILIFESSEIEQGWNGKVNKLNELAQQDIYVYHLKYTNDNGEAKEKKGRFCLVR